MKKSLLLILILSPFCFASAAPHPALISKTTAGWQLTVDGRPFFVKGIGCNVAEGNKKENYLKMAKDMNANSVRTWGTTPQAYFDKAEQYALKVDAGIWFNPIHAKSTESYTDPAYCKKLKDDALAYVRTLKDHPALLFWNLGNEVFTFTESETERKAFGEFLDDLIRAVKKEDPNHPVVYACAGKKDLEGLKAYVPSVDIIGINTYGSYQYILEWLKTQGVDKPALITEFGPVGEWEQKKDANGQPYDPYDQYKAHNYADRWREIENDKATVLGGYAFVLADQRNQGSLTYWNVNFGELKRESYWTLAALWAGRVPVNTCPRVKLLKIDPVKNLLPGATVTLDATVDNPAGRSLHYSYFITDIAADPLVLTPSHVFPTKVKVLSPGQAELSAPKSPGTYRVYILVDDGHGNAAVADRSISVSAPQ